MDLFLFKKSRLTKRNNTCFVTKTPPTQRSRKVVRYLFYTELNGRM